MRDARPSAMLAAWSRKRRQAKRRERKRAPSQARKGLPLSSLMCRTICDSRERLKFVLSSVVLITKADKVAATEGAMLARCPAPCNGSILRSRTPRRRSCASTRLRETRPSCDRSTRAVGPPRTARLSRTRPAAHAARHGTCSLGANCAEPARHWRDGAMAQRRDG